MNSHSAWEISDVEWPADLGSAAAAFVGDTGVCVAAPGNLAVEEAETPTPETFLFAADPVATLIQDVDGHAYLRLADGRTRSAESGWDLWRQVHAELPRLERGPTTLSPGWVGYVGFEAARQLERLPATRRDPLNMPVLRMELYDAAIVAACGQQRAQIVSAPTVRTALGLSGRPEVTALAARWHAAASRKLKRTRRRDFSLAPDLTPVEYRAQVRKALEYIAAGDIYQVNFCQRFRLDGLGRPADVFRTLLDLHPAPYAALLAWRDGAIVSTSPERFLRIEGREVLTSPIKGTRPRGEHPMEDHGLREALWRSEKDTAELTMIVDLHRNDLGRVCVPGSVQVRTPRRIERHPRVYHTVADVVGVLRDGVSPIDALAACFPAGSISGVPKIRALEIIDELEPVARGAYTGAIGCVGLDGQATLSVAIRILQMRPSEAALYVGGGIVADSEPQDEYDETLAKAAGVSAALRPPASTLRIGP